MSQLEQRINQLFQDYRATSGGRVEDYFGTAYLEKHHGLVPEVALHQTARGNYDYGIDGYFLDQITGNLYLYQFKYSTDWRQFQQSMQRLIKDGIEKIFAKTPLDMRENSLLQSLRTEIEEFKPKIRVVYLRFVFTGNPGRAEESENLRSLREQIEEKRHLLTECFERDVALQVQFSSTLVRTPVFPAPRIATFSIDIGGDTLVEGPDRQSMHAGFLSLATLHSMFVEMGARFFDRNIRAPLARRDGTKPTSVSVKITDTLKRIILEKSQLASEFSFLHNGVTLSAQRLTGKQGRYEVTEPRILNGAQTVATVAHFCERYSDSPKFKANIGALQDIRVLCKIVANAER